MKKLSSSLIIFNLLKKKIERDLFLIEFSVSLTKKYSRRCKDLVQFNEDLKQSIFLKQIIDVCAFLDEFKVFRSLAKENEKIKNVCKITKPALDRIEVLKGLRDYRNALAAHNFRLDSRNDEVVLLSDYTKRQDCPNSIAELFLLGSLCITIIEAVCKEFNSEQKQALSSYELKLEDDSDTQLRGVKKIREAYDEIEKYRINLNLQPKFIEHEFGEINMALCKMNWGLIPRNFQLAEDETNKSWSVVLGIYFEMRGYQGIKYYQGSTGNYTGYWLEIYDHALVITNELGCFKPSDMRRFYSKISNWEPCIEERNCQNAQFVYDELMKVVTP